MRHAPLILGLLTLAMPVGAQSAKPREVAPRVERRGSTPRNAQTIRAEYAAVLLQSRRYEDAAREYRKLLALDERNLGYRLGLARALAWDDRFRDAERELRQLATEHPRNAAIDTLLRSVRASYDPDVDEASAWVAERAAYQPYRLALARALVRARRAPEAIALLDTLVAASPAAALLLARARIFADLKDFSRAEMDSRASLAAGPTVDAYLLLGDLRRWQGDFAGARLEYDRALRLQPRNRTVRAALAQLGREERPIPAFVDVPRNETGWQVEGEVVHDNTGARYATSGLRRGFDAGAGAAASIGAEYRRFSHRTLDGEVAVDGYAVEAGLSRRFTYARVGARGGLVVHSGLPARPFGSLAVGGTVRSWDLDFDMTAAPAYPSLLTLASLLSPGADGVSPLMAHEMSASLAGPLGRADVALGAQRTRLGDDNVRWTLQAYTRYPLAPRLSAVYSASEMHFAQRSLAYWDPLAYVAHAVGAEYAARRVRGLSYAIRVLPGFARAEESPVLATGERGDAATSYVLQFSSSGEASYRAGRWEAGAGLSYGRGRRGGYSRVGAGVHLRIVP